jgi:hypothetical protein
MSHRLVFSIVVGPIVSVCLFSQGTQPYPNAITNRLFYAKTPMAPPAVNTAFKDPDLGATMLRITDGNTYSKKPNDYFLNPTSDVNEWSSDNSKFYVAAGHTGANLAFAFNPAAMSISALRGAGVDGALIVPLRAGPTFSFLDPDLMYGTTLKAPLMIATYRFSTGQVIPLFDTQTCGTQPPLAAGPKQSSTDSTISGDDNRIMISAGGGSAGHYAFVVVYDQKLGCRWYNTQTGQIGGQWGPTGQASIPDTFSVNHSKISGNGRYARIGVAKIGFYVWDIATLNVQVCRLKSGLHCGGYGAVGYDSYFNAPGVLDELNTFVRPLGQVASLTQLANPLPQPYYYGMETTWGWTNGVLKGSVPVCGTTYSPVGNPDVRQPFDGEVVCIETDGVAQTIWRFAHNRTVWDPEYFWTQPFGNISSDGRFFSFTSSWDGQVGTFGEGDPRTDVWMVSLD